jgi:hypothetical protein
MSDEESEHDDEAEEIEGENKSGFFVIDNWSKFLSFNNLENEDGEEEEKSEHGEEEAEEEVEEFFQTFSKLHKF